MSAKIALVLSLLCGLSFGEGGIYFFKGPSVAGIIAKTYRVADINERELPIPRLAYRWMKVDAFRGTDNQKVRCSLRKLDAAGTRDGDFPVILKRVNSIADPDLRGNSFGGLYEAKERSFADAFFLGIEVEPNQEECLIHITFFDSDEKPSLTDREREIGWDYQIGTGYLPRRDQGDPAVIATPIVPVDGVPSINIKAEKFIPLRMKGFQRFSFEPQLIHAITLEVSPANWNAFRIFEANLTTADKKRIPLRVTKMRPLKNMSPWLAGVLLETVGKPVNASGIELSLEFPPDARSNSSWVHAYFIDAVKGEVVEPAPAKKYEVCTCGPGVEGTPKENTCFLQGRNSDRRSDVPWLNVDEMANIKPDRCRKECRKIFKKYENECGDWR